MKVKLRDIVAAQQSYSRLLEQSFLPARVKYNLSKDGKKIVNEIDEISKLRNDLIIKYGTKGKDGMVSISPNSENMQTFQLEYDDLLDEDIELATDVLDIELFIRDDCTLSAKDFIVLEKFIVEKVEESKKDEVKSE